MDIYQYAAVIRDMLQKELDLENRGLQWLVVSQGLLFTALGFLVGKGVAGPVYALFLIGLISSSHAAFVLAQRIRSVNRVLTNWEARLALEEKEGTPYDGPPVWATERPAPYRSFVPILACILPGAFFVVWCVLAVATFKGAISI